MALGGTTRHTLWSSLNSLGVNKERSEQRLKYTLLRGTRRVRSEGGLRRVYRARTVPSSGFSELSSPHHLHSGLDLSLTSSCASLDRSVISLHSQSSPSKSART